MYLEILSLLLVSVECLLVPLLEELLSCPLLSCRGLVPEAVLPADVRLWPFSCVCSVGTVVGSNGYDGR